MSEATGVAGQTRTFADAISALREGDLSQARISRLSDLTRDEARTLAAAWESIPEGTRVEIVRRCDELSEERVDLNFSRALRIALDDPSPVVRQFAIEGLWEDESLGLFDRLRDILKGDASSDVRAAAAAALERFGHQAVMGSLDPKLASPIRDDLLAVAKSDDSAYAVRRRALEALGPFAGDRSVAELITEAYDSGDHGLQCSALYAMGRSLDPQWLPNILTELESNDPELQYEASRAAGSIGSPDAFPALLDAARSNDAEVRHAAIAAIGQIGGRGAARALERLAEDAGEADLELIEAALDEVNSVLEPFHQP